MSYDLIIGQGLTHVFCYYSSFSMLCLNVLRCFWDYITLASVAESTVVARLAAAVGGAASSAALATDLQERASHPRSAPRAEQRSPCQAARLLTTGVLFIDRAPYPRTIYGYKE